MNVFKIVAGGAAAVIAGYGIHVNGVRVGEQRQLDKDLPATSANADGTERDALEILSRLRGLDLNHLREVARLIESSSPSNAKPQGPSNLFEIPPDGIITPTLLKRWQDRVNQDIGQLPEPLRIKADEYSYRSNEAATEKKTDEVLRSSHWLDNEMQK